MGVSIHHGIDVGDYPFQGSRGKYGYLFSIGRITGDKGQDIAVKVAQKTGLRLILAGNVQNKAKDRAFFGSLKASIDLIVDAIKAAVPPFVFSSLENRSNITP